MFIMILAIVLFITTCVMKVIEFFKEKQFKFTEFFEFMNLAAFSLLSKSLYASNNVDPEITELANTPFFQSVLVVYFLLIIASIAIRTRNKYK